MRSSVLFPLLTLCFLVFSQVSYAQTSCNKQAATEKATYTPATEASVVEVPTSCRPAATCQPQSCSKKAGFQIQLTANAKEEGPTNCGVICPPECCPPACHKTAAGQEVGHRLALQLEESDLQ